jgi:hypothetical protein
MNPRHGFTTQSQPWRLGSSLSHLLGNVEDLRRRRLPSVCIPQFGDPFGNPIGMPRGLYLYHWGALGRAPLCLARDIPWETSQLGVHKLSLV